MNIRTSRLAAGLSQAELARALGVTQPAVNSWERRGVKPRPASVRKMKDIFAGVIQSAKSQTYDPPVSTYDLAIEKAKLEIATALQLPPGLVTIRVQISGQ